MYLLHPTMTSVFCAGKAIVHSLGGIHPRFLIPIVVDVGCNTDAVRDDPLYIGVQQVADPDFLYITISSKSLHDLTRILVNAMGQPWSLAAGLLTR